MLRVLMCYENFGKDPFLKGENHQYTLAPTWKVQTSPLPSRLGDGVCTRFLRPYQAPACEMIKFQKLLLASTNYAVLLLRWRASNVADEGQCFF